MMLILCKAKISLTFTANHVTLKTGSTVCSPYSRRLERFFFLQLYLEKADVYVCASGDESRAWLAWQRQDLNEVHLLSASN